MYMINLIIIYDVVNIFSMKNYESLRKLRVGVNRYTGVNWSTWVILIWNGDESGAHVTFGNNKRFIGLDSTDNYRKYYLVYKCDYTIGAVSVLQYWSASEFHHPSEV